MPFRPTTAPPPPEVERHFSAVRPALSTTAEPGLWHRFRDRVVLIPWCPLLIEQRSCYRIWRLQLDRILSEGVRVGRLGTISKRTYRAGCRPRYLLRDRDGKFPALFDAVPADLSINTVLTGVRMPRMNAVMERWVQTCRRELLDPDADLEPAASTDRCAPCP
jgi:hypothetical protein